MTSSFPLIFLGGIGALIGAVLGLASKKFQVLIDTKIEKIRQVLPSINCGACGYATCEQFARAVAEGKSDPTGCVPGNPKAAHAIGDILGISVTTVDAGMAVVHCKGGKAQALERCIYDGIHDCHAAIVAGYGSKVCVDGCLGLGSCVTACPFDALSVNDNNVAVVDSDKCVGCGMCVAACPRGIIGLIPRVHKIFLACSNHDQGSAVTAYCSVGCTSCQTCVEATKSGAITMHDNLPDLDYSREENFIVAAHMCPARCFVDLIKTRPKVNIDVKCDGCGVCVLHCPVGAIKGERGMRYVIDKEKCIGCGQCLDKCHVHAIALWGGLAYSQSGNRGMRFRP